MNRMLILVLALCPSACATVWQVNSLEEKLDRLVANTQRETLVEIFGDQAQVISSKIDNLEVGQRDQLDQMLEAYQTGQTSLDAVRSDLVSVLGGSKRVVASTRGVWVRDLAGQKLKAIARNSELDDCRQIAAEELPESIQNSRRLMRFNWGLGQINGEDVYFPWELTMSTFAKEVVENTARRTAEEFLKMSEGRGWQRPVYIQLSTDNPTDKVVVSPSEVEEVYVVPEGPVDEEK